MNPGKGARREADQSGQADRRRRLIRRTLQLDAKRV